jgi:CCR4-NOT transcription complex subunit 2
LYSTDVDGNNNPLEGSGLLGGGLGALGSLTGTGSNPGTALGHQQQQQQQRSGNPSSSVAGAPSSGGGASSGAGSALSGDFGLLGLLGVIRMTDQDRQSLALGSDLTLLGLNLNANEQLFSSFAGPWSENLTSKEPHYQVCCLDRAVMVSLMLSNNIVLTLSSKFFRLFSCGSSQCVITCNHQR